MIISELPDEILVDIISLLTLKEVGSTSSLSKRWRHIWAYKRTLKFDMDIFSKSVKIDGPKHLNWVDQVVRSYKAHTIDEFRVHFNIDLPGGSSNSIDNWFKFAMEKGVKRLDIDLSQHYQVLEGTQHTFPSSPLCSSLTSLEMDCININGEILEYFLSNCRALEYLSVKHSDSLVHLKVSGPYLSLKYLRLHHCHAIKELEISAPNLESICYYGPKINVQFTSTPKLAQVSFGSYANDLNNICSDISGCLSQIKELTLDFVSVAELQGQIFSGTAILTRLEKLDVMATPKCSDSLFCLVPLIKLWLHVYSLLYNKRREIVHRVCPHYHLKVVEIVGFVGYTVDLEFAAYLLECAVSLDKIITDTQDASRWFGGPNEFENTKKRVEARQSAERLRAYLKHGTELEIT